MFPSFVLITFETSGPLGYESTYRIEHFEHQMVYFDFDFFSFFKRSPLTWFLFLFWILFVNLWNYEFLIWPFSSIFDGILISSLNVLVLNFYSWYLYKILIYFRFHNWVYNFDFFQFHHPSLLVFFFVHWFFPGFIFHRLDSKKLTVNIFFVFFYDVERLIFFLF
jgi:hypothetical protein